jgi:hypothetical protein
LRVGGNGGFERGFERIGEEAGGRNDFAHP